MFELPLGPSVTRHAITLVAWYRYVFGEFARSYKVEHGRSLS
jgi:hypothetical protein